MKRLPRLAPLTLLALLAAGSAAGAASAAYDVTVSQWMPVTTSQTLPATGAGELSYECNAASGAVTLTLPTAVRSFNSYRLKKIDSSANACTFATTSNETIDGASTVSVTTQFTPIVSVSSDSSNWETLGTSGSALYARTAAEISLSIVPTNYTYPPYTILRYATNVALTINGTNDGTAALQTALNAAAAAQHGIVTVGRPGTTLKIGSSWAINPNLVGIDFQGAFINASSFTSGNWVAWTQTNSDPNQRPLLNGAHPFENATIYGPGSANTRAVLFNIFDRNPISKSYWLAGLVFKNITSWDWGQDVIFGNGAFAETFRDFQFGSDGGAQTTYSVTGANASNSGERNNFSSGFWFNKTLEVQNLNSGGEIYISQSSLDGAARAIDVQAGTVICTDCHIESSSDADYWVYVTGTNSRFMFSNLSFVLDAAKTHFPLMYADSSATWGGIFGDAVFVSASKGYGAGPLVAGTGNTAISKYIGLGTAAGQPNYISAAQNQIYDPIFATGAFTADAWTASTSGTGASAPTIVASHPFSGSNSVQFVGAATGYSTLTGREIPCAPGQQVSVELQAELSTFGAGAQFVGNVAYLRADGTPISSVIGGTTGVGFQFMDITAQTTSYAAYSSGSSGGIDRAPQGTAYVRVSLTLGSGAATGYLGRAMLTIN
jgi:hypothetical protein